MLKIGNGIICECSVVLYKFEASSESGCELFTASGLLVSGELNSVGAVC